VISVAVVRDPTHKQRFFIEIQNRMQLLFLTISEQDALIRVDVFASSVTRFSLLSPDV